MNATMETILHRRSIRSFLDKPIPKPVLEEIGGNIILTLRSDGSAYGQINNASMDGTWAQLENQITLYLSNRETITLEVEEESLLLQQEEDLTLVFEKTE